MIGASRRALGLLAAGLLCGALGCQTFRSFSGGCPGVYSGARYYGDQIAEVPFDGKLFFTLDLPLTALLDTLVLPGTAFANPRPPPGGYSIGCRWADRR